MKILVPYLSLILLLPSLAITRGARPASLLRKSHSRRRRSMMQESFLWYEPFTTVTDDAAIDLDQQKLQEQLLQKHFHQARAIYEEGGYSHPYAILKLDRPLRSNAHQGLDVTGISTIGENLLGKVRTTAKTNSTILEVEYHFSPNQKDIRTSCRVGGNPNPVTEGCFATTGNIEVETLGTFSYSYNALADNDNSVTLQSFSTQAKENMWDCQFGEGHSNCPYPTFLKYYQYYGAFDYGNQWINAAFDKTKTNFVNGNADFSLYTDKGRAEAIQRATIQMNLWMMVIREMEHSIEICEYTKDEDDHLSSWDKAVAHYMGSIAKEAHGKAYEGYSLYTLAEERCLFAHTCDDENVLGESMSISRVNDDIFKNFQLGQSVLLERECDAARTMSRRIMTDMIIPLVQGTLRYAYQMDSSLSHAAYTQEVVGHDLEAGGAVFAASFLPLLHSCSMSDADTLHRYMGVGSGQDVDFAIVKSILERNYDCLGITCEDVGGIADVTTGKAGDYEYLKGGEPCVSPSTSSTTNSNNHRPSTTSNNKPNSRPSTGSSSTPKAAAGNNNEGSSGANLTSFNNDIAVAIGVTLGVLIGIGLAYFYFNHRRTAVMNQNETTLSKPDATVPLDEVTID